METKAEALDLGHLHGRSVRGYHLGEVFGKCINLLLEEEKGCTDGTQLSFVHDKGELLHRVGSASKFVPSGYAYVRQKSGNYEGSRPTNDLPSQQALADLQEQPTLSRSFPPV